jgi:flagellar motility protein MotE (MotC chaperone)
MNEEKPDEKAAPPPQAKASFKPVLFTALGVFVVALGVFSWLLGVFTQKPAQTAAEQTEAAASQTADGHAQEASNPMAKQDAPVEDTLSGSRPEISEEDYTSGLVDSMEAASWLAKEKLDIQQQHVELDAKKRELTLLKHDIEKLLERVQEAKSERIVMMAKLYDTMEPEAVAKQISSMEDRTVVMLLPQMNTRTAAKVMALLEPKRAAQITTKLLALDQ